MEDTRYVIEEKLKYILWTAETKESARPDEPAVYQEQEDQIFRLEELRMAGSPRIVTVRGKQGCGRRTLIRKVASRRRTQLVFADIEALYQCCLENGSAVFDVLSGLIGGMKAMFCLIAGREESDEERWSELLYGLVREGISCYVLTDRDIALPREGRYEQAEIRLLPPDISQRVMLWNYFLSRSRVSGEVNAAFLAGRYTLNAGAVERVVQSAGLYRDAEGRALTAEKDIIKAVEMYQNDNFSEFAVRVPSAFTWEDLIVSEETQMRLAELCGQVKYRSLVGSQWGFYDGKPYGRGVSALFFGPSGTGKTMAAQIVAGELGLALYRVDMSQMMSKYIGETQKNISSLFDRAKEMNIVLLFDEADAFFTKRTGVKDSHDRHSNGEVAHLLQRMEEYEGISILTTNLKDNMDEAFRRRIKMMIEFQLPDEAARRRLWEKALPPKAPVEADVDLDFYARQFELSGSEIKETMLNAAFLAAPEGGKIADRHVKAAVKQCYLKYGKLMLPEELEGKL